MKPSQVKEVIKIAFKANQPIMLHGSPGSGKSDVVDQASAEVFGTERVHLIDLRASQLDPVDVRGIPYGDMSARLTRWLPPEFLPKPDFQGTLFLDEINQANQATQAALYQLVLDRRVGDYVLPAGCRIVAAGNRQSDRAIVNQMSTALRNRFQHVEFEVNHDDWCAWAVQADIAPEVIAFIRFRPTALNEFEAHGKSKEEKDRVARLKDANAFATPRSWEFVSNTVKQKPPRELEAEIYGGIVGEGNTAEFLGYMKHFRDLPDLDYCLMNPKQAEVPKEPQVLLALATGIACKASPDNFDRVMTYMSRVEDVEFQVLCVKDSILRDRNICNTKAFSNWTIKNKDLMK